MCSQRNPGPNRPDDLTDDMCVTLMERIRGYRSRNPTARMRTAVRAILYAHFNRENSYGWGFHPSYIPWLNYLVSQFGKNGGKVTATRRKTARTVAAEVRPWSY